MSGLERYSYVWTGIVLVAGAIGYSIYAGDSFWSMVGLGILGIWAIYWVVARRGALTPMNPDKRFRKLRGNGRPLVVHFYSDFALGCLLKRPFVAGAEKGLAGKAELLFLSMTHTEVRPLSVHLGAAQGEYVLLDGTGRIVERTSSLSPDLINRLLESPVS